MEILVVLVVIAILGSIIGLGISNARASANRAKCASNLRQIGTALLTFAADNEGFLPKTRHSVGRNKNWIYTLQPYLTDVQTIRVCPADELDRQREILRLDTTSYLLNDSVFDPDELDPDAVRHDNVQWIPTPSRTLLAVISNRQPSASWDHTHSAEWTNWYYMLQDVAIDRHRTGHRTSSRLNGDANYLYADGRVENIDARDWKSRYFDHGINPGAVPTH